METIKLIDLDLPDFGMPETIPDFAPRIYRERLKQCEDRVRDGGLDAIVVYADREHTSRTSLI
jgi:hypothetical protein